MKALLTKGLFFGLFAVILLHQNAWIPSGYDPFFYLNQHSEAYIRTAESQAERMFLLLSALKAGLALMQSSSAGIGFVVDVNLTVGELMQPLKEMVDLGWEASRFGMVVNYIIELLVNWAQQISFYAIHVFFAAMLYNFLIVPSKLSSLVGLVSGFLVFLVQLLVPLTVLALSLFSSQVTASIVEDVYREISENHRDIHAASESDEKHSEHVSRISGHFHQLKGDTHEKHRHMSYHIVRHLVVTAFNVVLFPLAFLVIQGILGFKLYKKWKRLHQPTPSKS